MARRRTREELESEIAGLRPYQELAWCLLKGEKPIAIASGDHAFLLYGADRSCGGVVVQDSSATFACEWCQRVTLESSDPYLRDCAAQIRRAQKEGVEKRYAKALDATTRV